MSRAKPPKGALPIEFVTKHTRGVGLADSPLFCAATVWPPEASLVDVCSKCDVRHGELPG